MSNYDPKKQLKGDETGAAVTFGGLNGSTTAGFEQNSIVHPNNYVNSGNTAWYVASRLESDPYPRAIVSRFKIYNPDFNIGVSSASVGAVGFTGQ